MGPISQTYRHGQDPTKYDLEDHASSRCMNREHLLCTFLYALVAQGSQWLQIVEIDSRLIYEIRGGALRQVLKTYY